jgi:hypothetical protein
VEEVAPDPSPAFGRRSPGFLLYKKGQKFYFAARRKANQVRFRQQLRPENLAFASKGADPEASQLPNCMFAVVELG